MSFRDDTRRRSSASALRALTRVLLLVAFAPGVHGDGGALEAQAEWGFGAYLTGYDFPSTPLLEEFGPASLRDARFLSSVGGVAFRQVVEVDPSIAGRPLTVEYLPGLPDGRRLAIRIGQETYRPYLADWQLVPIARYADSDAQAAVSLFGPASNDEYHHAVYHPAFINSLLGLRLLHADVLLIDLQEFSQLPVLAGRTVLGIGEIAPGVPTNDTYVTVSRALNSSSFTSWVLTDDDETVSLSVVADTLRLTGEPYYHFWVTPPGARQAYERQFNRLSARADSLVRAANACGRAGNLDCFRRDSIAADRVIASIDGLETETAPVPEMSRSLRQIAPAVRGLNPAVFEAATRTMRFAALFRHVKERSPESWGTFITATSRVQPKPPVLTPTQFPRAATGRAP